MGDFIMPAKVPVFRISGIAFIDDLGDGNQMFAMYAKERHERVIQYKAFMASQAVYTSMQQVMTHLGYQCCGGQRSKVGMN